MSQLKEQLTPFVLQMVTGLGAGFIGVQIAVAVLETKINYIEADIKTMQAITMTLSTTQAELSRRGEWMKQTDRRLARNESDIARLINQGD